MKLFPSVSYDKLFRKIRVGRLLIFDPSIINRLYPGDIVILTEHTLTLNF